MHTPPSTAAQRNRGIETAETPLVLLIDDDVTLQSDYVEILLKRWQRSRAVGPAGKAPGTREAMTVPGVQPP